MDRGGAVRGPVDRSMARSAVQDVTQLPQDVTKLPQEVTQLPQDVSQLPKDSGVVGFKKSNLVLSSTKFDFGLFWRASCQRTAASGDSRNQTRCPPAVRGPRNLPTRGPRSSGPRMSV